MRMSARQRLTALLAAPLVAVGLVGAPAVARIPEAARASQPRIPTPVQYFGFEMGTTGKLAGFSEVLDYFQLISDRSNKVDYHLVGPTTKGNDYTYLTISAPRNLARFDQIVQAHNRLGHPAGLTEQEARRLAERTVPIYYIEATIHSTEVGNGQAIVDIVHRIATGHSEFTRNVLRNSVIVLVPSQNPDGQQMVIDYFHETAGTEYERVYPDLYHKYTGHDDNRDWIMSTQIETRHRMNLIKRFRPVAMHIMHQKGGGTRIFVPPYSGNMSPDVPPNVMQSTNAIGQKAALELTADGKRGVTTGSYPIWWSVEQPGGYAPFLGTALYLSEIASVRDLAYPVKSDDGEPLGPQIPTASFPEPYDKSTWTLEQIVDYAKVAAYAGMEYVAKHGESLLYNNLYAVASKAASGTWTDTYAFVIPREQHDQYATYELLRELEFTQVRIQQATRAFTAGGKQYRAGSYVIKMAQPLGRWAHEILRTASYPNFRPCGDECPVALPYSQTATTLPMGLGVEVAEIDDPFEVPLDRVEKVAPRHVSMPQAPGKQGAYLLRPNSYGVFRIVDALQDNRVPTFRAAEQFQAKGRSYPPGTYVVPPGERSRAALEKWSDKTGVWVSATNEVPQLSGFQLKPDTRIGLYHEIGNMSVGWMWWLFDQWDINYKFVESQDFEQDLNSRYDVIVVPDGVSKKDIVKGLKAKNYPEQFSWAYGAGKQGWQRLRDFVHDGGTLLAVGSSVQTANKLLDLPIRPVIGDDEEVTIPGSYLAQRHRPVNNPVAWGMRGHWPVYFLGGNQAYEITDPSQAEVVSRYPAEGQLLESGYARGEEILHGKANVISYQIGDGYVVTSGTELTFRTLTRATFKLVFNAIYHGPSKQVAPAEFAALQSQFSNLSPSVEGDIGSSSTTISR